MEAGLIEGFTGIRCPKMKSTFFAVLIKRIIISFSGVHIGDPLVSKMCTASEPKIPPVTCFCLLSARSKCNGLAIKFYSTPVVMSCSIILPI